MKYQLSELIDLVKVQRLMESLYQVTGIKQALIDNESNILAVAGGEVVCRDFHRQHPVACARCRESDRYNLDHLLEGPYVGHQCPNGLMDYAAPVFINDQHVASVFTGQVFHEQPDFAFFNRQAEIFGFDKEAYLAAVRKVPIVPPERMSDVMAFLIDLTKLLSEQGLMRLEQLEAQAELRRLNENPMRRVQERTVELPAVNRLLPEKIGMHARAEDALRQEKNFFDDLINSLPGMFYVLDEESRFARWNRKLSDVTQYTDDEVANMFACDIFPAEAQDELRERVRRVFEIGQSDLEAPLLTKSGQLIPHYFTGRRTVIDGRPYLVGLAIDVSERHAAEVRRRESEEKLRSLFDLSPLGIALTDLSGRFVEFNCAFARITGYDEARLKQLDYWALTPEGCHEDESDRLDALVRTGRYGPYEKEYRRADGSLIPLRLNGMLITGSDGEPYIWSIVEDITLLKEHQDELRKMAHYDALTGIPNRALLAERMSQAIAGTTACDGLLAVCYLDLDGFKPINDRFGHDAGDRVLIEIAGRLRTCLRSTDTVARIGGDEFVLLIGLGRLEDCDLVLERLLSAVSAPMLVCGHTEMVSASLGATVYPLDNVDGDALIRHADQAMYAAKQAGNNHYHLFDPEQDRRTRSQLEQIACIGAALRNEEFVLEYQPKVNMRLGTIFGAEALIRWQHPVRGRLPPGEFLPAVESTDQIVAIGDWVIAKALGQVAEWYREGFDLSVSVNVAARHLLRDDFVARLQVHLADYPDLPPGRLELEVLETAALEDIQRVAGVIRACRELGVSFALDDFGTGYSSLTYLKLLPVETVKIDQTFVRGMLDQPQDIAIVEGIVGLSKVFGHHVVAEGVETPEHGVVLLQLGCELAQGYGVARPMPAADLPDWARAWRPDALWRAQMVPPSATLH